MLNHGERLYFPSEVLRDIRDIIRIQPLLQGYRVSDEIFARVHVYDKL